MKMTRIIPMLPVKNLPASIQFYGQLGFRVTRRNEAWGWATLRLDACRVMLDQSINEHPDAPRQSVLYFYVDDVAGYHQQLRAANLPVPELNSTFYGMKEFRLQDPDGNRLWIGQAPSDDA